eukprot:2177175-Heterocapsa_arctica.AAC.1
MPTVALRLRKVRYQTPVGRPPLSGLFMGQATRANKTRHALVHGGETNTWAKCHGLPLRELMKVTANGML